jgi:hypothetical protein
MKKTLILLSILTSFAVSAQSIEINPNGGTNASAILDLKSTTKGFLLPRMTNAQMRAIPSPAQGLLAFCTDCSTNGDYYFYKGTAWVALGSTTVSVSTTMGSVSDNSNVNGATITNGVLNLAPANATNPGIITTTTQTIAGVKTFSNGIVGNVTGNAATVTTNANLTGVVTSNGNATSIANGAITNAMLANGAVANLSGTNTGDQILPTLSSLGAVASNTAITGATNTKITYDAKGLVTAGAAATTADIAASTNKNYVTDAQLTVISNTSGTNTGDNAVNSLYSGLVSNATHTGDVTGATVLNIANDAVTTAKIAAGAITDSKVTDVDASKITGTLPVSKGGTGTTNGSITGTGALTFAAGGSNQNISITPSGTGSVGIGTSSPTTTAALDVTSTTKGFLPPRLSSVQRNDITNPTEGLVIYNSTNHCLEVYRGTGWFNLCNNAFVGQPLNLVLGGVSPEISTNVQQTTDGGYIISGYSYSVASGDITITDPNRRGINYWIVKLDALGNIVLNRLLGGNSYDYATSIQQTADGGYIISGYTSSSANGDVSGTNHGKNDCWIVKLNALGDIVWNKLLGGSNDDFARSIQQTTDGGYIISGISTSSANGDVSGTNHGYSDYWIVKLDALGNIIWNKLLGGSGYDDAYNIQQTTDGGYIISGYSASSANGDVSGTNHGGYDYWIVKLDALGNIVWNKLLGGSNDDYARSIQQTTDGGYIISGYSDSSANGDVSGTNHGDYDYWIVKLNAIGNIVWNKLLGGSNDDYATFIQQTTDGGYIISGYSGSSANGDVSGTNHGSYDYWIVKLNAIGNIVWNNLLGGNNADYATSIQQTTDGGYIISGTSGSSANGDVSGTNHVSGDYWIVKLDALGNILF